MVNTTNVVTTIAGGGSVGGRTSGFVDGIGALAKFFAPAGVALDAFGNIFVADSSNNAVRMIASATLAVSTVAGLGPGLAGLVDGAVSIAQFSSPRGIAIDGAGIIFVADFGNHVVRKISAGVVSTLAGGGAAGGTSQGAADGTGVAATFAYPSGLALDSVGGNLFVSELGNVGSIRRVVLAAAVVSTVVSDPVSLDYLESIAVDLSGSNIFAGAQNKFAIRKISSAGAVTTYAGGTYGRADGPASSAQLAFAVLAVDSTGAVVFADRHLCVIRKVA